MNIEEISKNLKSYIPKLLKVVAPVFNKMGCAEDYASESPTEEEITATIEGIIDSATADIRSGELTACVYSGHFQIVLFPAGKDMTTWDGHGILQFVPVEIESWDVTCPV